MICKNCEYNLDISNKFCPNCGGKVTQQRVSFSLLTTEFFERFLSFDSKFFLTFKALFLKPELVINGYIEGARHRFVNPISYTIIAVTLTGFQFFLIKHGWLGFDYEKLIGMEEATANKTPFSLKKYMDFIFEFQNLLVIVSIPFLALIAKIVMWKNKKYNFAEHNIILAYSYSHYTIVAGLLALVGLVSYYLYLFVAFISSIFMFFYMIYAVQRVFDFTAMELIKKIFLYFLILGFVMLLLVVLVVLAYVYVIK